jgi:hypothetical protein
VATDGDGELVTEDVVLGFEVGGYYTDYFVKSRFGIGSGKERVCIKEACEACSRKSGFGGYVEDGGGGAMGGRELRGEKKV